jgi:EPS-associated MarR family transcriptional regulator
MIGRAQEETLSVIKEIETNPTATQRAVSKKLGISLGKTNYLLKELIAKGLIKCESFSNNPGKLKKITYLLTAKGFEEKMCLMQHFLKKKETEYKALKDELEKSQKGS